MHTERSHEDKKANTLTAGIGTMGLDPELLHVSTLLLLEFFFQHAFTDVILWYSQQQLQEQDYPSYRYTEHKFFQHCASWNKMLILYYWKHTCYSCLFSCNNLRVFGFKISFNLHFCYVLIMVYGCFNSFLIYN